MQPPVSFCYTILGGLAKVIRAASPQARRHFTRFDQMNQLVEASKAAPDLAFIDEC